MDVKHVGITPARAGKRAITNFPKFGNRDHPRACGEKRSTSTAIRLQKGSPPRVRGKDDLFRVIVRLCGITPARAGKRPPPAPLLSARRDHPRACGEKRKPALKALCNLGSPPRVRGKADAGHHGAVRHGITPARAGKRSGQTSAAAASRDHPRACGEKVNLQGDATHGTGSPPRVRGKAPKTVRNVWGLGITPARAGKRGDGQPDGQRPWDHPRACGEKYGIQRIIPHGAGSPPRVRGKD